jgi:hypothetical protein
MGKIVRLVLLLIGIWLVYQIVRDFLRRLRGTQTPPDGHTHRPAPTAMTACTLCGTFVPRDQAIERGGKYYCSAEHAAKHAKGG